MQGGWVKLYQGSVHALSRRLSLAEEGALWRLSAYVGRGDTLIRRQRGGKGDAMTAADIAVTLGLTARHARRVVAALVDAGALVETRAGKGKHYAFAASVCNRYGRT